MSSNQITHDTIPEGLLSLMGALSDEWWGDGHCDEGMMLQEAVGHEAYTFLALVIAAYNYIEQPNSRDLRDAFMLTLKQFTSVAEGLCTLTSSR